MVIRNIESLPLDVFYVLEFIDTYYIKIRCQIEKDLKKYNIRAYKKGKRRFRYGKLTQLTMVLLRFCFKTNMTKDCRGCCAEILKELGLDMTGDQFKTVIENMSRKKKPDIDIFDLARKSEVDLTAINVSDPYPLAFPLEIGSLLQIFKKYLMKMRSEEKNSNRSSHEITIPYIMPDEGNQAWLMRQYVTEITTVLPSVLRQTGNTGVIAIPSTYSFTSQERDNSNTEYNKVTNANLHIRSPYDVIDLISPNDSFDCSISMSLEPSPVDGTEDVHTISSRLMGESPSAPSFSQYENGIIVST